jgi:hypothetical protein
MRIAHPRCVDFRYYISSTESVPKFIYIEYVRLNGKIDSLSTNGSTTLNRISKRSFYVALEIVSRIENVSERNSILQILYSISTYAENNFSADLLKMWIDEVHIQKTENYNQFINQRQGNLKYTSNILIKLGFDTEGV